MENWKIVMSFSFIHEAHIAKGFLESAGIETELRDEMAAYLQEFSLAAGGVKILVKESDYPRSIELLTEGGFLKEDTGEKVPKTETVPETKGMNKETCPFCGSDNISVQKKPNISSVILSSILGLFYTAAIFPSYKSTYKCFDCEKDWKYSKQRGSEKTAGD